MSQAARKILEQMSLEEKTGQMFIARCPEEDAAAVSYTHLADDWLCDSDAAFL